ncbi:MAG: hypothetical protein WC284_07825 [Candidimonas sp.]
MNETSIKQIQQIVKKLNNTYGYRLDINIDDYDGVIVRLREAESKKQRIVKESHFNDYNGNPEYAKYHLICEALTMILREIAPRRKKKAKTTEAAEYNDWSVTAKTIGRGRPKTANVVVKARNSTEAIRKATAKVERDEMFPANTALKYDAELARENLSESEFSGDYNQFEVIAAAKGISSQVMKMAERMASIKVEDMLPLIDRMKIEFGSEKAHKFSDSVDEKLGEALDALKEAKETIDNECLRLEGKYTDENMNNFDEESDEDESEDETDLADISDDDDGNGDTKDPTENDTEKNDENDLFDILDGEDEEPLGRSKKTESVDLYGRTLIENKFHKGQTVMWKGKETTVEVPNGPGDLVGIMINGKVKMVDCDELIESVLPVDVQTMLDNFKYSMLVKKKSLNEAKKEAVNKINEHEYGNVMSETLNSYIEANREELLRISRQNTFTTPKKLIESMNKHGFDENQFNGYFRDMLKESRKKMSSSDYTAMVEKITIMAEKDVDRFVEWVGSKIKKSMAMEKLNEVRGYRKILSDVKKLSEKMEISEHGVVGRFKKNAQTVWKGATLRNSIVENGFISINGEMIDGIDAMGPISKKVSEMAKKALDVKKEYVNEHGKIDKFGQKILENLNTQYKEIDLQFEAEMSKHLK